ncbi:c-type cytochrome [Oceanobacillus chungangensis]|nr:cytochrome c [Oceanobacillus chungangensis]
MVLVYRLVIASNKDEVIARVKAGGETMPAFEGTLTEEEINDVAEHI